MITGELGENTLAAPAVKVAPSGPPPGVPTVTLPKISVGPE
jgi:hypothetical protein